MRYLLRRDLLAVEHTGAAAADAAHVVERERCRDVELHTLEHAKVHLETRQRAGTRVRRQRALVERKKLDARWRDHTGIIGLEWRTAPGAEGKQRRNEYGETSECRDAGPEPVPRKRCGRWRQVKRAPSSSNPHLTT